MSKDVNEVLDDSMDDPTPLPSGSYVAQIAEQPGFGPSKKGNGDTYSIKHRIVSAQEDVDPDMLEEFTSLGPLSDVSLMHWIYLPHNTPDQARQRQTAKARLRRFSEAHEGPTNSLKALQEWMEGACVGAEAVVRVRHTTNDEGDVRAEVFQHLRV